MSRFAKPLQFIEVLVVIGVVALAWPVTVTCGAPHKTCTPPPNEKGEIIRPAEIEPFAVVQLEKITGQDLPWSYKQTTTIERPLLLDQESTATESATPTQSETE